MSKLLFLGTGAADWFKPDENGNYRRHASVLIDGHIMIDCTESALDMLDIKKIPYESVDTLFITHSHSDHFQPAAISKLIKARQEKFLPPLTIYCDAFLAEAVKFDGVIYRKIYDNSKFDVRRNEYDKDAYIVTPLPANHTCTFGDRPWHYLFENESLTWYYATDGAWMTNIARLTLMHKKLDCWVVDYTVGDTLNDDWRIFEHNTPEMVRFMRRSMIKHGMLDEKTPVICTHMARTLHTPDEKVEPPFMFANDGMEYEINPL